ncbi:MAG: hypothetical protein ACOYL6_04175 [Bacteriovoracaceae bacterium]
MTQRKYKSTKIFPVRKESPHFGEEGQSFIEFVLLMLMVIGLSFGYMKIVNGSLAKRWTQMVNVVVNDGLDNSRGTASMD